MSQAEWRRKRIARNPERLCPPDHKHAETSTCHRYHGCNCGPCVTAGLAYVRTARRWRDGSDYFVDATGTRRRLQAAAVAGYGCTAVAGLAGLTVRPLQLIRSGQTGRVRVSTAAAVKRVAERLCMSPVVGTARARTWALRRGWVGLLAWNDVDDPREQPKGVAA